MLINLIKKYGLFSGIRTIYLLLSSKLLFRQAYLINRPAIIIGKKFIKVEKGFSAGPGLRLEAIPKNNSINKCLFIGENCIINDYVHIGSVKSVKIGNNVLMASKIFISDHNHGFYGNNNIHTSPEIIPSRREMFQSDVEIGDNVWIGEFVSILPGSKIGNGCVIGANSVVNSIIPQNSIAVGAPAKVVKQYNFEKKEWVKTIKK